MKKVVACVFAHPDDEAFGPSGTIAKLAKTHDVYILCARKGEAGESSLKENVRLEKIREKELLTSAKILGVKNVFFLGFTDGDLSNNLYHKLASKIEEKLKKLRPEILLTFDVTGGSGHIDHIVVSLVTTYVFYRLKFVKELWYRAITPDRHKALAQEEYFIYRPDPRSHSDINKKIDVSDVWETKVKAMLAHKSQRHDAERMLRLTSHLPKEEAFVVKRK